MAALLARLSVSGVRADGRADLPEPFFLNFLPKSCIHVCPTPPRNKRGTAGGHESTVALMGGVTWLMCNSLFRSDTTRPQIHSVVCVSPVVFLSTKSSSFEA